MRNFILASLACWAALQSAGEDFTVQFNPPDNARYIETSETSRVVQEAGETVERIRSAGRSAIRFEDTGDSIRRVFEPRERQTWEKGKETADGASQGGEPMELVKIIDDEGRLIGVEGTDAAVEQFDGAISKALGRWLKRLANRPDVQKGLLEKEAAEWARRHCQIYQRAVEPGDAWTHTGVIDFPRFQKTSLYSAYRAAGIEPGEDGRLLKVRFYETTDQHAFDLAQRRDDKGFSLDAEALAATAGRSGDQLYTAGTRTFDLNTGLLMEEELRQLQHKASSGGLLGGTPAQTITIDHRSTLARSKDAAEEG